MRAAPIAIVPDTAMCQITSVASTAGAATMATTTTLAWAGENSGASTGVETERSTRASKSEARPTVRSAAAIGNMATGPGELPVASWSAAVRCPTSRALTAPPATSTGGRGVASDVMDRTVTTTRATSKPTSNDISAAPVGFQLAPAVDIRSMATWSPIAAAAADQDGFHHHVAVADELVPADEVEQRPTQHRVGQHRGQGSPHRHAVGGQVDEADVGQAGVGEGEHRDAERSHEPAPEQRGIPLEADGRGEGDHPERAGAAHHRGGGPRGQHSEDHQHQDDQELGAAADATARAFPDARHDGVEAGVVRRGGSIEDGQAGDIGTVSTAAHGPIASFESWSVVPDLPI